MGEGTQWSKQYEMKGQSVDVQEKLLNGSHVMSHDLLSLAVIFRH